MRACARCLRNRRDRPLEEARFNHLPKFRKAVVLVTDGREVAAVRTYLCSLVEDIHRFRSKCHRGDVTVVFDNYAVDVWIEMNQKIVNSLRSTHQANPNSPTLANFMALVKWVDTEAAAKLSKDIGIQAAA